DIIGLQPVERFIELPGDLIRVAERGMGALADEDEIVAADTAALVPVAEEALGAALAVDPGGVEQIATGAVKGIEQDRGGREALEIFKAHRNDRCRTIEPGDFAML